MAGGNEDSKSVLGYRMLQIERKENKLELYALTMYIGYENIVCEST